MKLMLLFPVALCCAVLLDARADTDAPDAAEVMQQVLARLPREPLEIHGELWVRGRHGRDLGEAGVRILLDLGAEPPLASYLILSPDGAVEEKLTILRPPDGQPEFRYAAGSPLKPAPLPELSARIRNTDLSWMDLTLSFLWWTQGRIEGREAIRGRMCRVLELAAPEHDQSGYARVRLWIDETYHVLIQAEGYDGQGVLLRRLWVKSFEQIDGRGMVKDFEVQSFPTAHRTRLRVKDVLSPTLP